MPDDLRDENEALLKHYEEEKKALIRRLNKALDGEKHTYERLADLDITRHVEVADLKREIGRLTAENEKMIASELESIRKIDRLSAENEKLKAVVIENVRAAERLKRDAEVKKLQLKESEDERAGLTGRLKELQVQCSTLNVGVTDPSPYGDLSGDVSHLKSENASLKESLSGKERENAELAGRLSEKAGRLSAKDGLLLEKDREISESRSAGEGLKSRHESEARALRAEIETHLSALKRLDSENEELKARLKEAGSEMASFREEKAGLAGRLSALNAEIERLRAEKAGEMELQTAGLKEASEKTEEMLERLETGIRAGIERLDELYQRQTQPAVTPVVVRERRPRRKSRSLGLATAAFIATAVIAVSGLSWYALTLVLPEYRPVKLYEAFKNRLAAKEEPPQTNPLPPPPLPAQPSWTGTREVANEGFTFTLTFLTPDLMEDYGIPAKAGPDALARNFFYVLEVKAENGCIPDGLINNPRSAVSFIGQNGNLLRPEEIPALDASRKAVYKVDACEGKLGGTAPGDIGAVLFRYFMALPKTEGIQGATVEGLIGNLIIIK